MTADSTVLTTALSREEHAILTMYAEGDHPNDIATELHLERVAVSSCLQQLANFSRSAARQILQDHATAGPARTPQPDIPAPSEAVDAAAVEVDVPAGELVAAYEQWWCLTCGGRYREPYPDHGATPGCDGRLEPVLVTITRREVA